MVTTIMQIDKGGENNIRKLEPVSGYFDTRGIMRHARVIWHGVHFLGSLLKDKRGSPKKSKRKLNQNLRNVSHHRCINNTPSCELVIIGVQTICCGDQV